MDPEAVVIGVVMGSVLLVFGLVPGLLHSVGEGVRNFIDGVQHQSRIIRLSATRDVGPQRPIVLAVLGIGRTRRTLQMLSPNNASEYRRPHRRTAPTKQYHARAVWATIPENDSVRRQRCFRRPSVLSFADEFFNSTAFD